MTRYMSMPLSIRFSPSLVARLRRQADSTPGATPSLLAQRLVEEGLRMAEHPGILFKDGPSGRRAALAFGPDVWEIVKVLKEVDERGEQAVHAAADLLALPAPKVRVAMHYFSAYQEEIDREITEADRISVAAEDAWHAEQRLLA
jgi:hypothetical protein